MYIFILKTNVEQEEHEMAHYIPPINWGMVEEDLYRSGQPNVLNFPFLERLNLKTIIWLAPDDPTQQLYSFTPPTTPSQPGEGANNCAATILWMIKASS